MRKLLVGVVIDNVSIIFCFFITLAIINSCEKRARQVSLGILDHLKIATLTVHYPEDSAKRFTEHLQKVDVAFVVVNFTTVGFNDTAIARIVHHHYAVMVLDYIVLKLKHFPLIN